jgi:hypothetical protein
MTMRQHAERLSVAAGITAVILVLSAAQQTVVHAQATTHADISGFWVPRFTDMNVPTATLTPAAMQRAKAVKKQEDHVRTFCNNVGMPALMYAGPGIDVTDGQTEVAIITQINASARHIYLARSEHPDANTFDPTTNGDSIGKWVGNKLIVDTTGFETRGLVSIPGGGYRTATSHLIESFELVDGGKYLEVVSTWTDPKTFVKPHTYLTRYSRAPVDYRTEDWNCVPADNDRLKAMIDSPQPVTWPK